MGTALTTMEKLYTLQVLFTTDGMDPGPTEVFAVPISAENEVNWIRKLGLEDFDVPVVKSPAMLSADNRFDVLAFIGVSDDQHEYSGKEQVFVILETIGYNPDGDPGEKLYFNFRINTTPNCEGTVLTMATVGLSHSINR